MTAGFSQRSCTAKFYNQGAWLLLRSGLYGLIALCGLRGCKNRLLHLLAGCRKSRLNQVLSVLYLSMFFTELLFVRAHFYVLLWTHAQRASMLYFAAVFFIGFFFMAALVGQTAERIFTKLSHVVDIRHHL